MRAKKTAREIEQREDECSAAVNAVLKSYNCALEPILKADKHGIYAMAQIVALPPKDDQPKPDNPAPPVGGATTGGEDRTPAASPAPQQAASAAATAG